VLNKFLLLSIRKYFYQNIGISVEKRGLIQFSYSLHWNFLIKPFDFCVGGSEFLDKFVIRSCFFYISQIWKESPKKASNS